MKRVLLVVVAVVAALLVVPGGTAMACSCAGLKPAQSVAGADVVLQGTVTEVDRPSQLSSSAGPAVYTVEVTRVFKGEAAQTTFVQSAVSGASCGLEGVEPGREYVLFAEEKGGELWSGLCGGSGPATADLVADVQRVVGQVAAPPAAPATQDPSSEPTRELPGQRNPSAGDGAWLVPVIGGSVLALLLGAGLVLVLVRGRRRPG